MADHPRQQPSVALAALWMAGAVISFMTLAVSGREAARFLTTSEILLVRAIVTTAIITVLALATTGGLAVLMTRRPALQVVRNALQFGGQFFWLFGLPLIPLAQVFALEFTVPLWVAVLAPLILGERMTWTRAGVAFLGFLGVMVVLRPGIESINVGSLSVLVCAVFFALAMLATKALSRTEHPFAVIFYMGVVQLPIALVLSWERLHMPPAEAWPALALVAVSGMCAHYCLVRATKLADAVIVAPLDFMRVPLIAVVGALLYGEAFDPVVLAGAGLILLANFISVRAEHRRQAKPAGATAGD